MIPGSHVFNCLSTRIPPRDPPSLPPSLPPPNHSLSLLTVLPTYVFDCIDDVQTKAELLMYAQDHHLRVISALGAGLKADPTRLCIGCVSPDARTDRKRSTAFPLPSTHFCFSLFLASSLSSIRELDNTKNEPLAIKLRYLLRKQGRACTGTFCPLPSFSLLIHACPLSLS
jgi:hypothetical protein